MVRALESADGLTAEGADGRREADGEDLLGARDAHVVAAGSDARLHAPAARGSVRP